MNGRDQRRYDRLSRTQTFGRENSADFAQASRDRMQFAGSDQHLANLDDEKAGQTPARVSNQSLLASLMLDFKNLIGATGAHRQSTRNTTKERKSWA